MMKLKGDCSFFFNEKVDISIKVNLRNLKKLCVLNCREWSRVKSFLQQIEEKGENWFIENDGGIGDRDKEMIVIFFMILK